MAAAGTPGAAQAPSSGGNGGGQQRLLLPPPLPAHTPVSREQPPGRGGRPSPGRAGKWVNCGAREARGLLGNVVAGRGGGERGGGGGGLWGCPRLGRGRSPAPPGSAGSAPARGGEGGAGGPRRPGARVSSPVPPPPRTRKFSGGAPCCTHTHAHAEVAAPRYRLSCPSLGASWWFC
ncbi:translation initiation factor IF-2-like [Vulpes lagopus]|uniref:translation initiation factor IF-2-like n=1 Tax=Vulpes lagopus TaxID=494514 RepID=UPI001BC9C31A|nr:translation initiation factor IF-2-like [Vulpes lagopus]